MTTAQLKRVEEQLGPALTPELAYKNELISRYTTAAEKADNYPSDPTGRSYWEGSRDTYKSLLDNQFPGWHKK